MLKKETKSFNLTTMQQSRGANDIVEIEVDPAWANLEVTPLNEPKETAGCGGCCSSLENFVEKIAKPINAIKGYDLPVSAFLGYEDGTFENGTSAFEKRGVAVDVPIWNIDKCIQCNQCSYVCPHAVIRPFLINEEELKASPIELATKKPCRKKVQMDQHIEYKFLHLIVLVVDLVLTFVQQKLLI